MLQRLHLRRVFALCGAWLLISLAQAQAQPVSSPAAPFALDGTPGDTISPRPQQPPAVPGLRIYSLDCGQVHLPDMGMFSDTGEYDGLPGLLAAPCFIVAHPKGTLLWDTGLGDSLAGQGRVTVEGGVVLHVERSLKSQLQRIGIENISYLAFSHFHFDHTGNANAFPEARWIVNRRELDAAMKSPSAFVNVDNIKAGRGPHVISIDGDHDVFGDGSVRILAAPGHSEGHQVLLVRLAKTGPVILSGDLYHTRENRKFQRVPAFNVSRADSLASMNRIETIARNLGARIIIQHDPQDFASLPAPPAFLD